MIRSIQLAILGAALLLPEYAPAGPLENLPANRWIKLDTRAEAGYRFSQPIYVPSRRKVLHWGGVARSDTPYRNDVRAFDVDKGDWTSDYAIAEELPSLQNPPYGKGIWYTGKGEMLDYGTPAPSAIANGVCYDSKRDQVIFTMKGLMAAYDPHARKWRDMEAKTIFGGREYPGGPPVYGVGTCYDPLNDEIVLFPHWGGDNREMVSVHGRASAHWGTFRYRFAENTWRRAGDTFGTDEIRRARQRTITSLAEASCVADEAWRKRRRADDGCDSIRRLENLLEDDFRVEPRARTGTSLVFHPKINSIIMFGGESGINRSDLGRSTTPGSLNDTWACDCKTRQWRELETPRRPPPTLWPKTVYHPGSDRVLLVTRTNAWQKEKVVTIWALDAMRGEWTRLHEQPWEWGTPVAGSVGWAAALFEIALDPERNLLIMTQVPKRGERDWVQETFVFRLDTAGLEPEPAPKWTPPPPIRPQVIPPNDPQWVRRMKSLPANTWVPAIPSAGHSRAPTNGRQRLPANRGWGIAAVDPVRSLVCYFGGGHSSYQFNDVAVYAVGANRWLHTAGEANDWVPPVGWGGITMGLHGGPHAHHQRNTYVALDGRVWRSVGTGSRRWSPEAEKQPGPRYAWFWDIDRGGVWRMQKIAKVTLGEGVPGTWGQPHVVDPAGKVYGLGGALEPYDGRFFPDELYFSAYDVYSGALEVKKVDKPHPAPVPEYRPFCYLSDRRQIFFYEYRAGHGHATWVYDVEANRFIDLKPERQPPGQVGTVLHLQDQNAVFAPAGGDRQWVYSFDRNTWAPLPVQGELSRFDPVYAQTVYVPEYGVLVNLPKTEIMRPEVGRAKWP